MDYAEIIGQILGFLAVIFGFISFQMKTHKKLMLTQVGISGTFVIHYLLIGAKTACVLNFICVLRNLVYCYSDKKIFSGKFYPPLFAFIMVIFGAFSWQGWYSLFSILGLGINTICLSLKNPQKIRYSILVTSPLIIIYDIVAKSYGGLMLETTVMISSIIGIIRYRKQVNS